MKQEIGPFSLRTASAAVRMRLDLANLLMLDEKEGHCYTCEEKTVTLSNKADIMRE